jgi:hypothetical protein
MKGTIAILFISLHFLTGTQGAGGHGFIMKKQNLPCDTWLERFTDWLSMQYP